MARQEPRTTPCDASTRAGRHAKAREFLDAAGLIDAVREPEDRVADALVTLYIHAGIAAADVICCARLGRHARGEGHNEAVRLLEQADREAARSLGILLRMKTKSGYSSVPTSSTDLTRARRAAEGLLASADQV